MSDIVERLEHYAKHVMPNYPNDLCSEAKREIETLRNQLVSVRNAGAQALRQWKMYADMTDGADDFEKSAEGSVYLACKSLLTGETGE